MLNILTSFFAALQDMFETLFFSSSPGYKKKKKLKMLFSELKTIKPLLYRDKTLLPAFGLHLYELYSLLLPIKEILENTIASMDISTSQKHQSLFFEAVMQNEQKKQLKEFNFSARNADLAECKTYNEAEKKLQKQQENFENFGKIFQNQAFKNSENILTRLFSLADLCNFDYAAFLWHFNKTLDLTEEPPALSQDDFGEAFAEDVLQNLLDLQFILGRITFDQSLIQPLLFCARQLPNFTETFEQKIKTNWQHLNQLFSAQFKKNSIPIILKLLKNDPEFEENAIFTEIHPLHDYQASLQEAFQTDTRRLSAIQKDAEITGLIEQCFGKNKLKMITGYNEKLNTSLQKVVPESFEWVRPMQLLKSFTDSYFTPKYNRFLQGLLVEGMFTTKQTEAKYAAVYRSCEPLQDKITTFEQLFKPNGPCSEQQMQGYIAALEKGLDVNKKLLKMIDTANTHAKDIVQTASKNYMELYAVIGRLLDDIKTSRPQFITNLRQIMHTGKNKELFGYIENDYTFFGEFLTIMKNYAVLGSIDEKTMP